MMLKVLLHKPRDEIYKIRDNVHQFDSLLVDIARF